MSREVDLPDCPVCDEKIGSGSNPVVVSQVEDIQFIQSDEAARAEVNWYDSTIWEFIHRDCYKRVRANLNKTSSKGGSSE